MQISEGKIELKARHPAATEGSFASQSCPFVTGKKGGTDKKGATGIDFWLSQA